MLIPLQAVPFPPVLFLRPLLALLFILGHSCPCLATIGTGVFAFIYLPLSRVPLPWVPACQLPCSPCLSPAVCTKMCFKEPGLAEGAEEEDGTAAGRGSRGRNQPWGPATAGASWGRKVSPGWINGFFNQATVITLKASGKPDPLSHANIYTCLNRGGSVLLPSHRFQSSLASPENKQPCACFFFRAKAQFTAWHAI